MKIPKLNDKQKECLTQAKRHIESDSKICHDLCDEIGQIFNNVKHMTWFQIAVANHLIENVKKWNNCELIEVK